MSTVPRPQQLAAIRELARCYQAFEAYSARQIRAAGLTPAQFDIIATLGNTAGMSFKELGARTLITKGTLTGVVDRLEARRLVRRHACASDGRSQIVALTPAGEATFATAFPAQMAHLDAAFAGFAAAELGATEAALARLRRAFEEAVSGGPAVAPRRRAGARRR